MKLHMPLAAWSITVLDQHKGIHTFEADDPQKLYNWMMGQDETAFFTALEQWRKVVAAAEVETVVRVETEFDCDYVVVMKPESR